MTATLSIPPAPDAAPRASDALFVLSGALAGTTLAWLVAAGCGEVAPQSRLGAAPAFFATLCGLLVDIARGRARASWRGRTALVLFGLVVLAASALGSTSGGAPRDPGVGPECGHAAFLAAALAFELLAPEDGASPEASYVTLGAVVLGALVTAWYGLVVWANGGWLFAALALGAGLGALLARRARLGRRRASAGLLYVRS